MCAINLVQAVLPLAFAKDASTRARLCIFIHQFLTSLGESTRDNLITTELDDLLPTLLEIACVDNIAAVRAAALPALAPWSGRSLQLVRNKSVLTVFVACLCVMGCIRGV